MQVSLVRELTQYEEALHNQLLINLKLRARIDELILHRSLEDVKNGRLGDSQTEGGNPSSTVELKEDRDTDF
jgi:hypothetical protein